jgi:hypothetical protein
MTVATQQQMVLDHMKRNGSITSWDAITDYHITRLSGITFNLRNQGYYITSTMETNGDKHYARYTLWEKSK